jgi:amino acid adenylation domain-containing protein
MLYQPINNERKSHSLRNFQCIHDLFSARAVESPDSVALEFNSQQVTYQQLEIRSIQFANKLISYGINKGDLVALYLERSPYFIIALLGIMKAGAVFVPIDTLWPIGRAEYILNDTKAKLIVVQDGLRPQFKEKQVKTLVIDASNQWEDSSDIAPSVHMGPKDLIYVLYTSGTTGEPKGVMLEHGGISNVIQWMNQNYKLSKHDRVLQKTPYTFDASMWEIFTPLIAGATLVLAKPDGHRDPYYLVKEIINQKITIIQIVPSMLRHLLLEPSISKCISLRHVFCGGEKLTCELKRKYFSKLDAPLHNLYGPTETSIQVMAWTCSPTDTRSYIPIGRPIANVTTHILDQKGYPVSEEEIGELYIGGIALARGYLGKPDKTAEFFIDNLDPEISCSRLYRTGDLVRKHTGDIYEFIGRIDDQVKKHGYRIELGEIEARLNEVEYINNAVVMQEKSDKYESTRLIAYLETECASLSLTDLRNFLSINLPDYMIPGKFKVMDRFPLSTHGKVDRAKLRTLPAFQLTNASKNEKITYTKIEQKLIKIWSKILDLDSVGIHDDFFELGGDSIAGLVMIAHAKQQGIVFTPHELFKLRRIDQIVRCIQEG